MTRNLILIPTYNEAENVLRLYQDIKNTKLAADILFIDDNSPDGTSKIINNIRKRDRRVNLIKRKSKEGVGSAHMVGITWAYKKGYKNLISMDSDLTHKPEDIRKLIIAAGDADVVVGSRYLSKQSLSTWNPLRKALTRIAHFLTKRLLAMPYDATGAFRLYRFDNIPKGVFSLVESTGYSFFFESLFILHLNKFRIKQISIVLPARTYGSSKMSLKDAFRSLKFLFQTYYLSKVYEDSYLYSPPVLKQGKNPEKIEKEWDEYWRALRNKRKILYDAIAVFYRKYIIRKPLNYFVKKTFKKGQNILHAGCGGGQVDTDVVKMVKITALDISTEALNRYKRLFKDSCQIMHASIFNIPVATSTFDGIYNLGVMEHLTKKEIKMALDEFNRVLKGKGKILLFWPPRFGLSVLALNFAHFVLNNLLGKNVRLHPHEISKIKSKKEVEEILVKSNFRLTGFHFGPRDLFTYVVVVGEKIN